jgi:transcriptional regulator with XRE-family HTH domain
VSNERLRGAILARDLTISRLASLVDVDAKSVERWVTQSRQPHPRTRAKVASALGREETYLWPGLLTGSRAAAASTSEFVQMWAARSDVPLDVWREIMRQTRETVEILVYAGGFLVETLGFADYVVEKAVEGAQVRILLGDSNSEAVRARGVEENLLTLPQRCRSTLEYLADALAIPGVSIRTHHTPLYASIYRFDGTMLVNTHTFGAYAARSPVQHLQEVPGGRLFALYTHSFEQVWATARPVV